MIVKTRSHLIYQLPISAAEHKEYTNASLVWSGHSLILNAPCHRNSHSHSAHPKSSAVLN